MSQASLGSLMEGNVQPAWKDGPVDLVGHETLGTRMCQLKPPLACVG